MNTGFKLFIAKLSNFILNVVITLSIIVSLASITLQLLPEELSNVVLEWLSINVYTLVPTTISTSVSAVVLLLAKYGNNAIKLMISNTEIQQSVFRKELEDRLNHRLEQVDNRDEVVIDVINKLSTDINELKQLNKKVNEYNLIAADKNIASKIIPNEFKNDIKKWKNDLNNMGVNTPIIDKNTNEIIDNIEDVNITEDKKSENFNKKFR